MMLLVLVLAALALLVLSTQLCLELAEALYLATFCLKLPELILSRTRQDVSGPSVNASIG